MLVETVGWRGARAAYATHHLTVSLPLCFVALPRFAVLDDRPTPTAPQRKAPADPLFWLLAAKGMPLSLISAIVSVHQIVLLQGRGVPLATAVALSMWIGTER